MTQQPGQPPPPYYPAPYAPPRRPTNTMAIVALVCAFVVAPAGLVCGIIARRQIRQTGEEGDGMALAAIIVSAVHLAFIVLFVIIFLGSLLALGTAVSHIPVPSPSDFPSPFPTS